MQSRERKEGRKGGSAEGRERVASSPDYALGNGGKAFMLFQCQATDHTPLIKSHQDNDKENYIKKWDEKETLSCLHHIHPSITNLSLWKKINNSTYKKQEIPLTFNSYIVQSSPSGDIIATSPGTLMFFD